MRKDAPAFVFWGYGSENVFREFADFLSHEGYEVVQLPNPDKKKELSTLLGRRFILITSSHFTRDAELLADYYPDILIGCDFLELLHHCDPLLSVFYPHDLGTPLVVNEPALLSAFDLVLWPTQFFGYGRRPKRFETVGWIGFRGAFRLPAERRYERVLLFSDICWHQKNLGVEGTYLKLQPILANGTSIKFPAWPGSDAFETYFCERGVPVIPAETPAGQVILDSRLVISNGLSSISVEAAYMGTPVVNLLEDYLPEGTQQAFLSGLSGCVQCTYAHYPQCIASPPSAPHPQVTQFDYQGVLDLLILESERKQRLASDKVSQWPTTLAIPEIEVISRERRPLTNRASRRVVPRPPQRQRPGMDTRPPPTPGADAAGESHDGYHEDAVTRAQRVTTESAVHLLERDEVETAFGMLQELISLGTTLWEPYFHVGRIALAQKEREIAAEFLTHACEREEPPGVAHRELARLQLDSGHHEDFLKTLSAILRRNGNDYEALDLLRQGLAKCGELGPIQWARLVTDLRHGFNP